MAGEVGNIVAQRDGYRRVSEEAMKLLTDAQLLKLAERLDALDREAEGARAVTAAVHTA